MRRLGGTTEGGLGGERLMGSGGSCGGLRRRGAGEV